MTTRSVDAQESPVSRTPQATWHVLDTALGQEQFLVGPSPRDPDGEALAVFPPGAKVLGPAGSDPRVSTEGWRVALWSADAEGNRHTDVGEPIYVEPVPLTHVIGLVEAECPTQLTWVADRLMLPIVNACAVLHADRTGRRVSFAAKWLRDAELILHELDIALAPLPADGLGAAAECTHTRSIPDGLPECSAEAWLPRHPGNWDPRLREGKMRAIYEDLHADAQEVGAHRGRRAG